MNKGDMHLLKQEDYLLNRDTEMLEWIIEQVALGHIAIVHGTTDNEDYIYKLRVCVYGREDS